MSINYLIAIPVYNESTHVVDVLRQTRLYADNILVVDDGSTDDTPQLLDRFEGIRTIRHGQNLGYGRSLIDAFDYAATNAFDWIITMDCDEQHEPAVIPDFVEAMVKDDADIISGSRYLTAMDDNDSPPADRRSINKRITAMLNDRLGMSITDAFCGFKAHRVAGLSGLTLSETGYAFPMQFWPQVVANDMTVSELPIRLVYNDPNRHFGGDLDDPTIRHQHYVEVFESEMKRLEQKRLEQQHRTDRDRTDREAEGCCPCF
ncbi:MAG: glycosyltransferase family 2 protein [Planctomycetes bacterium]|nr:glycosyltransferase family 2 protein [Planctomycetota bacterium]